MNPTIRAQRMTVASWTPQKRKDFANMLQAYRTADAMGGAAGASRRADLDRFFGVK